MAKRPDLPAEAQAAIEQARDAIFKDAPKRFNLLFYPIEFFPELFAKGLGLDVPKQRMPETVKRQLRDYSADLFGAEARQRANLSSNPEELRSWLDELASEIESEVKAVALKKQLDYHCTLSERLQAIKDELDDRIAFWVEYKPFSRKATEKPTSPVSRPSPDQKPQDPPPPESSDEEPVRRLHLLAQYKSATGVTANRRIYTAQNSGIHKPEFYDWLNGTLLSTSQTCINFERFLRERKRPIPRSK